MTPTEVELVFSYAGKTYTVRRNPEYERPKMRGEGVTIQKADAQLTYPDGRIVTKLVDVNNAVQDIMGINRSQFMQISMIAQGDFLKLLLASTDQRKEIFRKIFKTQLFQTLQEKLKRDSGDLNDKCSEAKNSLTQYINGIEVCDSNVLSIDVTKAKAGDLPVGEVISLLNQLIDQDEKEESILNEEKVQADKDFEAVNALLGKIETQRKAREAIEINKKALAEENANLSLLKKVLEEQQAKLPEADKASDQKSKLQAELPRYDILEKLVNDIKDLETKQEEKQNELIAKQELYESEVKSVEELKEEQKSLSDVGIEQQKLLTQKDKEVNNKNKIDELLDSLSNRIDKSKELSSLQEEYKASSEASEKATTDYETKNKAYLDEQAGIIANTLEDGKPCPVCGSLDHPCCAQKSLDAPTEAQLNKAKKEANEAQKVMQQKSEACAKAKAELSSLEKSLIKQINELNLNYDLDGAQEKLEILLADTEKRLSELTAAIEAENIKIERQEALKEIIPEKEKALSNEKTLIDDLGITIKGQITEIQTKAEQLQEEKKNLKFESREKAEEKIGELEILVNQISDAVKNAESDYHTSDKRIAEINATIKGLEEQLAESISQDEESVIQKKDALVEARNTIDTKAKEINARLITNRNALKNIKDKKGDLEQLEQRYAWIKALSNTANGNISGKEKVMLETYIQMTFFDRIISRANTRFMIMSGGQYELKRRREAGNNKSQSGLDLDVIDHYNGTERSVKTLSGGESFKASLSLALGLSDEIQSSAGGVKLDTMFVDEGFGSLDEESLDQAMKALSDLAEGNRLVGIISHVSDLKNRIDKQIVVTKQHSGGSKAEVIV